MATFRETMPSASVKNIAPQCMKMRMVKTPEEIALTQRAMDYFARIHAFGRDYILRRGTDITDFDVAQACTSYGTEIIMNDIQTSVKTGHISNMCRK